MYIKKLTNSAARDSDSRKIAITIAANGGLGNPCNVRCHSYSTLHILELHLTRAREHNVTGIIAPGWMSIALCTILGHKHSQSLTMCMNTLENISTVTDVIREKKVHPCISMPSVLSARARIIFLQKKKKKT